MKVCNKPVVIADTDVISYDLKDDSRAAVYERLLRGFDVRISFVTVQELHYWAEKHEWGARRRLQLRLLLDDYSVFPYSRAVAETCARMIAERERAGRPMAPADMWIAATAVHFRVPLATNDGNFLETPGLRIISADPEICIARDKHVQTQRALDLNMRCGCGM